MNIVDRKIIYNLLCNNELLKYLDRVDKIEFSSTCKYIYNNCTRFRLSSLIFNISELANFTQSINCETKTQDEIFRFQLGYLESIVKKYRNYILKLSSVQNGNYYILEYYSTQFSYLTSLRLRDLIIPIESFKNIIENLASLCRLDLLRLGFAYTKNYQHIQIKFSKYLKELVWLNCFKYETDIKDPIQLRRLSHSTLVNNTSIAYSIFNSINSLKLLSWECAQHNNKPIFNELLAKNPQLKALEVSIQNISSTTLNLISNNINLTSLTITQSVDNFRPEQIQFIKLPYIKKIDSGKIMSFRMPFEQLIQSCPNLEELVYYPVNEFVDRIYAHVDNLKNLKKLTIFALDDIVYINMMCKAFPMSNLEHLEIYTKTPYYLIMEIFAYLTCLKSVKITYSSCNLPDNFDVRPYFDMVNNWRVLYYYNVVYLWKTDTISLMPE